MTGNDEAQTRYLAHQERKRDMLALMARRHSERVFADAAVPAEVMGRIVEAANQAPSSCDRKAVIVEFHMDRPVRSLLSGCLVGGVGWLHRAPVVAVFKANMVAYKSPAERPFMPWLDTGFLAENVYLACTELDLACCFINPNAYYSVEKLLGWDAESFMFTGAMALGYAENDAKR